VTIEGNLCEGTSDGDALTIADDSDFAIVRHNTVRDNTLSGIVFYNGLGAGSSLDGAQVIGNICVNNGTGGLGGGRHLRRRPEGKPDRQ